MKRVVFALLLFLLVSAASNAYAQKPFYDGKTINIAVGFSPGGTFDLWARVIAQYLPRYIPGSPTILVQNMPGGGSMIAANYVYNVAAPDGLTFGLVSPSLYIEQLAGRKEVQFDWLRYSWIGSPERTDRIFYIRADTGYKSFDDIRKAPVPPRCGATGLGTVSHFWPRLLEETLGARFEIVLGYKGASEVNLAIERGEVACWGGTVQAFFGSEPGRTWAKTDFVNILTQGGQKRHHRLPDVPTVWELMDKNKTPDLGRRLARVLLAPDDLGRPLLGSPKMPQDRVKIMRDGFMKMMNDPDLLAEAPKRGMEPSPSSGPELEALAKELMTQPPEVIERMMKLLAK